MQKVALHSVSPLMWLGKTLKFTNTQAQGNICVCANGVGKASRNAGLLKSLRPNVKDE